MPVAQTHSARSATLAWGVLGTLACAAVAPLEPNLYEEGLVLHVAERLSGGERLYSDVVAYTGPLPYVLLSLAFDLLRINAHAARVL